MSTLNKTTLENTRSNNNKGSRPTGNYLLSSEMPSNPKHNARIQYNRNKRATRREKIKGARRGGNFNIPKEPPNSHISQEPTNDECDYIHQSLSEYLYPESLVDALKKHVSKCTDNFDTKRLLNVLEVIGALSISLPMCTTSLQVSSQIVLTIRALTNNSISEMLISDEVVFWCKDVFGFNIFVPQTGEESEDVEWLKKLPTLKEDWLKLRNSTFFTKISTLITLAASIGLCSVANLKWSIYGVDIFRVGTLNKHASAVDFIGAVIDTIICFIEGGYECFRQRSFKPLLYTSEESAQLDELYFPLLELHEHAMVFNLHNKRVKIKGEERVISDIEYSQLLDEALDLTKRASKLAKGTWQQSYLDKRLEILHKNRASYQAKRIDGSMRYSPFTVYIWGESGVGKSTVAQIVMADCLKAAGVNPDPKGTAIIKESDKFDSSLKGDTVGIFFDDMGNTKREFLEKSPTERIIDINNNMITYANKADLHEKGKIEIRPKVFVITSNAPLATHAHTGSIHPFSIVRRADVHIRVKVTKLFATEDGRLDSNKAFSIFPDDLVNDLWDLEIFEPREREKGGNHVHLVGIDKTQQPKTMNIFQGLTYVTQKCVRHFENQRKLITKGEALVESRKYCPKCLRGKGVCDCAECEELLKDFEFNLYVPEDDEEQVSFEETFEYVSRQLDMASRIVAYVPTSYMNYNNKITNYLYLSLNYREFVRFERTLRYLIIISCALFGSLLIYHVDMLSILFFTLLIALHIYIYVSTILYWRDKKLDQIARRPGILEHVYTSIRSNMMLKLFSTCAILKVLHYFISLYRGYRVVEQTALAPDSIEEIELRDAQENPWATPIVEELHVNDRNATMTHEQVVAKIAANLCHGTFVENNIQQQCDVLALGGNVFLAPLHLFKNRKEMKATIVKRSPTVLNSTFRAFISVEYIVPVGNLDLALVYMPSGGIFSDISYLFPEKINISGPATFIHRGPDGELKEDKLNITYTADSKSGGPGYDYILPYNTYVGLCMGVAISKFARHCIASLHLRGVANTPKGKGVIVTENVLREALENAKKRWIGAFPSIVNGNFPLHRYEKQVLTSQSIHPKSPVNYLPIGSCVNYMGQGGTRVTFTKSKVKTLPISDSVYEHTGVPCGFGPPKFHRTLMWQRSLVHSANPSPGIEGNLLKVSFLDYITPIIKKFSAPDMQAWVKSELRPMSDMENLCGMDGKRFIDAVKKGTSKGFLLRGPKREWITMLDPLDYPGFQCPAVVDETITQQALSFENDLANGVRCYAIFLACVKDECTKLDSDKVRVFQAAEWAFQMVIRKYYLPIARLLSLFPLLSECAVGVNSQGPEWDELATHMCKFGKDRIFAGDYSKYDLRMPAQLIIAAFAAMIEIAERCGMYSERDLNIMRGISAEVAYSCAAYNGDLLIHSGSNPSGQNLTVYINCIVNSLLIRSGYFYHRPIGDNTPFRKNVAIMTYGDDVKGSVSINCDYFDHIKYAAFLRGRDMVFTMPDKESEPMPFMRDEEADFLKRKNIYNPDTGLIHGALDENSIFKSLHTVMASNVISLEQQSIQNIDGALREWWQYGRDVYEMRRSQMRKVAEDHELTSYCRMIHESYDDRLNHFMKKYRDQGESSEEGAPVEVYEEQTQPVVCEGDLYPRIYVGYEYCNGKTYEPLFDLKYNLCMIFFRIVLQVAIYYVRTYYKVRVEWNVGFRLCNRAIIYFLVIQCQLRLFYSVLQEIGINYILHFCYECIFNNDAFVHEMGKYLEYVGCIFIQSWYDYKRSRLRNHS